MKTTCGSSLHSVVCKRAHVLFTLFVFVCAFSTVILCSVFALFFFVFVYSILPSSLDCHVEFLIAFSVFSNVYLKHKIMKSMQTPFTIRRLQLALSLDDL